MHGENALRFATGSRHACSQGLRCGGAAIGADIVEGNGRAMEAGRRGRLGLDDGYYDRPPFSHGGYGLGACKQGAGHLPMALWALNRLLAEHEAHLIRRHHAAQVRRAAPHVPLRPGPAQPPPRGLRVYDVAVYPRQAAFGRLAFFIGGKPCPTLELVRGATYTFDQSHFSNLGDGAGSFALRFFTSDDDDDALPTADGRIDDAVHTSVVPPGMPGAHVLLRVGRATPPQLFYRATRAGALVDGGLVLVQDAHSAGADGVHAAADGRSSAATREPRRKPLGLADALAEREARVRVNARLLAHRDARHRAATGRAALGEAAAAEGATHRPVWKSRPHDPCHWIGGLPREG